MVEVNRDLYMDEITGMKTGAFGAVEKNLAELRPILSGFLNQ
jgi:hypothetical protein